jgi:hypothetical protein
MSRPSPAGAPLRCAALTRVSLRGFWPVSLIVSQKKAGFCPLDKLHTSVSYPIVSGDEITFVKQGVRCRGWVCGWKTEAMTKDGETYVLVKGDADYAVPLSDVTSRRRGYDIVHFA